MTIVEIKQFDKSKPLPPDEYFINQCEANLVVSGDKNVRGGEVHCPKAGKVRIDSLGICDQTLCCYRTRYK